MKPILLALFVSSFCFCQDSLFDLFDPITMLELPKQEVIVPEVKAVIEIKPKKKNVEVIQYAATMNIRFTSTSNMGTATEKITAPRVISNTVTGTNEYFIEMPCISKDSISTTTRLPIGLDTP